MTWRIELSRSSAQAFERASRPERNRLTRAIDGLARIPRPQGKLVKAIRGPHDEFLRLRVGDHRIIYEVMDSERVILIHGIIHRKDLEAWLRQRR